MVSALANHPQHKKARPGQLNRGHQKTRPKAYCNKRDSTDTRPIGGDGLEYTPMEECAPRMHCIAERSKEKPRQQRSQPKTTEYSSPHLVDKRGVRR